MKKVQFLLICLLPSVATWAGTTFDYAYDGQTLTYKVTDEAKKPAKFKEIPTFQAL